MPIVLGPSSLATPAWALTLADLERELARRVGPFSRYVARASVAGVMPLIELASTYEQGGLVGLYLLRRGFMAGDVNSPEVTGPAVAGFVANDRVRLIAEHDAGLGEVTVDRNYVTQTVLGEGVEVMALDPREIRRAMLRGLERAFFVDRIPVTAATYAAERDLTVSLPWLRDPEWVLELRNVPTGSLERPIPGGQWSTEGIGGHVWLTMGPDPAPASLLVRTLRPHASWVNGADSTTGPTADLDDLAAPLDYAVCMAHDWLWDTAKDLLRPLVSEGLGTPEEDVRSARVGYVEALRSGDRVLLPTDARGLRTY